MSLINLFRGTAVLSAGTAIAQAIPIASTPILARLYSPSDFGVAATYMAVVAMLSVAVTGRYEMAITLPKQDDEAAALTLLALKLSLLIGLLLFVPIYIFNEEIAKALGDVNIGGWLYLMPIAVVTCGAFNVFQTWNVRRLSFKDMGLGYVKPSMFSAFFNIVFGYAKLQHGMLAGAILGQALSVFLIGNKAFSREKFFQLKVPCINTAHLLRKYIRYPLVLVPAHLVGAGGQNIPLLTIGAIYNSSVAGGFSMAYRLLILPAAIVSAPIGEVLRAHASRNLIERKRIDHLFFSIFFVALAVGLVLFGLLGYFLDAVVNTVLGSAWGVVAEFGQLLLIPAYLQFVAASVDKIFLLTGNTRIELGIQMVRLMCFLPIIYGAGIRIDVSQMVEWIAVALSVFYIFVIACAIYMAIHIDKNQVA